MRSFEGGKYCEQFPVIACVKCRGRQCAYYSSGGVCFKKAKKKLLRNFFMRHSNNSYNQRMNQRAYAEKLFLHKGFCQIYRTSTHMYASVSLSEKIRIFVELNSVQQTTKASDGSERAFYCSQMYNNNNKNAAKYMEKYTKDSYGKCEYICEKLILFTSSKSLLKCNKMLLICLDICLFLTYG